MASPHGTDNAATLEGLVGIREQLRTMIARIGDEPDARGRVDGWREAVRLLDEEIPRLEQLERERPDGAGSPPLASS